MAAKLRLLLRNANVVLELHRRGLWGRVIEPCEFLIARTVIAESMFHVDDVTGEKEYIDLTPDAAAGRFKTVDVDLTGIAAFRARFSRLFLEKMDAGEQEALAYMVEVNSECLISSADAVVWRTLGLLALGEQGVSLEELLVRVGFGAKVDWQYTKAFREKYTTQGFSERLGGGSLRP